MAQNNEKQNQAVASAILQAVAKGCEDKLKSAPFNSCLFGVVTESNAQGTLYTVKVGQKAYPSVPCLQSLGHVKSNSSVVCIVPNNNISQMFILGVLST